MKIGIVTFYKSLNYGAMLQSYALWKWLESRGHEIVFFNHSHAVLPRRSLWRCFFARRLKGYVRIVKEKLSEYVSYDITSFADRHPQTPRLSEVSDFEHIAKGLDAVIVGSDQMWNPKWVIPDFVPVVFLSFCPERCKRISYAVSFSEPCWGPVMRKEVGVALRRFDAIGVREASGVGIVEDLSKMRAELVLDPVLLHDSLKYVGLGETNRSSAVDESYLFKYMINGWQNDARSDSVIKSISNQHVAKRMLTGYVDESAWIKSRLSVPDWLFRIQHSAAVVTNSYHCLLFAIIFHRPFYVFRLRGGYAGMNERIESLLGVLNLRDRIIDEEMGFNGCSEIDWDRVDQLLSDLRGRSVAFLQRAGL